ncbi:MAG: phenylalanine--tRNA ligase subunit beta [Acidimicrobiia bacterium]|nr:phenylalanine--tRNA ligase subunit beta [Acidimicrobiia bacterium]
MRVSLNWLREYVDLPTDDVSELKRAFDMLGHAVEEVEHFTAGWTDVYIGKVLRVAPHPNADAIRVTHVDLGDGEEHQIICGAWNFEAGAVVPVAIPGAVLPGGFEIGTRAIRGVESHGMICSERELGLGELHEGIMVLDDDAPIGAPFESILALPDVVFDLEITNNRPDVMGMVGVARELAAWYETDVKYPDVTLDTVAGDPRLEVVITATDGCNRFVAREMRDVSIGAAPLWMTERLRKAGVRAISNIVDVSNYVMLEMGHPMHAFDADAIAGDRLEVRWAAAGETLETLDGEVRELTGDDLVIVDDEGPTSLAAVMGGARSEVVDTTSRVIMEAASWNPPTVMYTSRRHDLRSEASARFERGVDPNLADDANARACKLLQEIGGGVILETVIDEHPNRFEPVAVNLNERTVQRLLGTGFDLARAESLLRRLHLDVAVGSELEVTVPTYRPDLTRPADLVEEIARLADFDTFAETVPTGPAGGLLIEQRRSRLAHNLLRGAGLIQAINLPFVAEEELAAFNSDTVDGVAPLVVTVRNPLREDQAKLRQSLLPGLLRKVRENRNRGLETVALFESGRVFFAQPWADDERVPEQPVRLAVAITGPFGGEGMGSQSSLADATTALALVRNLADGLGVAIERRPGTQAGFHPTRTAELAVDGAVLGYAGELHPELAEAFEISGRVAIIELDLDPLVADQPSVQMRQVSTYPHVDFDLSFEVDIGTNAGGLVAATVGVSELVESASIFDDYRSGSGERAVAIRYRLRAPDRTLDSDEIAGEREKMINEAAAQGAVLRGGSGTEAQ